MKLQTRNGKFYRGKIEVPAKADDPEQIECLNQYNKALKRLKDGRIQPNFKYEIKVDYEITFECACGNKLKLEKRVYDEDVNSLDEYSTVELIEAIFDDMTIKCDLCGLKYMIECSAVKLIE